MRKKLDWGSVRIRNSRILSSKLTLRQRGHLAHIQKLTELDAIREEFLKLKKKHERN